MGSGRRQESRRMSTNVDWLSVIHPRRAPIDETRFRSSPVVARCGSKCRQLARSSWRRIGRRRSEWIPSDSFFDRAWALQILERVLSVLFEEQKQAGNEFQFE